MARVIARLLFFGVTAGVLFTFLLYALPAHRRAATRGALAPLSAMARAIPPDAPPGPGFRVDELFEAPPPPLELPDLKGRVHRLEEFEGKVVFLSFWASWCPPCREEWASIQEMAERMRGQPFQVIAAAIDESDEELRAFLTEAGLSERVLILRDIGGRVAGRFGTSGWPETYLVDREGELVHRVVGPRHWDSPEALAYLRALPDRGRF
jgi:thiol-disulfide isomerase/thioredoxin